MTTDLARFYSQPGKQAARRFVVDLAVQSGCRTALDFWGGGTSAAAFVGAGLDVVSAEIDRALWDEQREHARAFGYRAHHGTASSTDGSFDVVWADFTGHVSAKQERELGKLALKARTYLAVTILPERESDTFVARARAAAIPAWLTVVTSMRLEYVQRYRRNSHNQEMWLAILTPAPEPQRAIYPSALSRNLLDNRRRYWAGHSFSERFRNLVPYSTAMCSRTRTPDRRRCERCGEHYLPAKDHPRYRYCSRRCFRAANRGSRPLSPRPCRHCDRMFVADDVRREYCGNDCRKAAAAKRARKQPTARTCVECGGSFMSVNPLRVYDRPSCKTRAYERRRGEGSAATLIAA